MDLLSAYRAFVLVADRGGFSAAARAADMRQSSVSRQIADLERHLGASLFVRTTRRVSLSEDGRRLLPTAREIVDLARDAETTVGHGAGGIAGTLGIAVPGAIGPLLVAPALCEFLRQHRDLNAEIMTSGDTAAMAGRDAARIQLTIAIEPSSSQRGEWRKLGDIPQVLCAAPALVRDRGAPRSIEDCAGLPAIVMQEAGRPVQAWRLERGAEHREVLPQVRLRCDDLETMRAAVTAGAGIALAPLWLVQGDIAAGRLWRLLPQWHGGLQPLLAMGSGSIGTGARPSAAQTAPQSATAFADHLARHAARAGLFA